MMRLEKVFLIILSIILLFSCKKNENGPIIPPEVAPLDQIAISEVKRKFSDNAI
ncbi:hypothetical protein [Sphingobacterium hungaricum]